MKVKDCPSCAGCPLRELHPDATLVPPKLAPSGERLAIGAFAGEEEARTGVPFTGGSGRWLRGSLNQQTGRRYGGLYGEAGVREEGVSYANVLSCAPPEGKFPTDPAMKGKLSKEDAERAIAHCKRAHLEPVLRARPWKRVDLFGDEAIRYVAGKPQGALKWRGSPMVVPELGDQPTAMACLHPAQIARDQTLLPVAVNDLRKSLIQPPEFYSPYPSIEEVRAFRFKEFAFDIETVYDSVAKRYLRKPSLVGLCAKPFFALAVPFKGAYVEELRRIFAEATAVVGHNSEAFDLPILAENGIAVGPECKRWDTILLHHLRFPDLPHDLEFVGSQFCNKPAWKHEKGDYATYNCRDVDVTLQCFRQLLPLVRQEGLEREYWDISIPMTAICQGLTKIGLRRNPASMQRVRKRLLEENTQLEAQLPVELRTFKKTIMRRAPAPPGTVSEKTGKPLKYIQQPVEVEECPWRSAEVKKKYLYETLGLPPQYHLKTKQLSVDKIALDKLSRRFRAEHPWLGALKQLSKNTTLLQNFLKEDTSGESQVIHPSFSVYGTSSGRLSSAGPNFQNQPETARHLYVPHVEGNVLVEADFSGIENRLVAWFANDQDRLGRFQTIPGFNEHKWVTGQFFNIPYEEVEKDNDPATPYGKSKRINHGNGYLMGARKIANMYDLDFKEVKALQAKLKEAMPATTAWQGAIVQQVAREGVLTNPFGRKRWFWRETAAPEGVSFLPQSSGADVIFRAAIGLLYERIGLSQERAMEIVPVCRPLPAEVLFLLTVHDSLLFECPPRLVDHLVALLKEVMEQPWPQLGGFILPISASVGETWGSMVPYKAPQAAAAA